MFLGNRIQGQVQRAQPCAGPGRIFLSDNPPELIKGNAAHSFTVKRRRADQQFIEEDTERIDIAASIHIRRTRVRLLRTHIHGSPHQLGMGRHQRVVRKMTTRSLGNPEVDDFRNRLAVELSDQDI